MCEGANGVEEEGQYILHCWLDNGVRLTLDTDPTVRKLFVTETWFWDPFVNVGILLEGVIGLSRRMQYYPKAILASGALALTAAGLWGILCRPHPLLYVSVVLMVLGGLVFGFKRINTMVLDVHKLLKYTSVPLGRPTAIRQQILSSFIEQANQRLRRARIHP